VVPNCDHHVGDSSNKNGSTTADEQRLNLLWPPTAATDPTTVGGAAAVTTRYSGAKRWNMRSMSIGAYHPAQLTVWTPPHVNDLLMDPDRLIAPEGLSIDRLFVSGLTK
jgi:hypothetical protein